ncbi:MAG: hypothetical protein M1828_000078 [Chrysothrix sp. TS-e1954]|nr:MAG: hypothetical protein M1828_000078 [Chrysothrix sp. TS-e1954]
MAASSNVSTHSFRSAVSEAASSPTTASYHDTTSNWDQQSSHRSTPSRRSSASADTLRPVAEDRHEPQSVSLGVEQQSRDPSHETPRPQDKPRLDEDPRRAMVAAGTLSDGTSRASHDVPITNTPAEPPPKVNALERRPRDSEEEKDIALSPVLPDPEKASALEQSTQPLHIQEEQTNSNSLDSDPMKPEHDIPSSTTPPRSSISPSSEPPQPPRLNYTLRTRYLSLLIFWTLILIDTIAIPITLYFSLTRYATSLSRNAVFSISTGALGGISIIEYFLRFWRLWRHDSGCRVLGGRRWHLDWFHWNFSAAWVLIMVELIVGTCFTDPPIRLLAMPVSTMLFWFAGQLLIEDGMRLLGFRTPVRISSVRKGDPMRPGIYSIIEDVVAVDGSGKVRYRQELNSRFEASHDFRQMLHRLSVFWGVGAGAAAVVTTVLVFTIPAEAAYVVGWVLPFVWAGGWALMTWGYVEFGLKREKRRWAEVKA